jgi:hypothetical protein
MKTATASSAARTGKSHFGSGNGRALVGRASSRIELSGLMYAFIVFQPLSVCFLYYTYNIERLQ